MGHGGVSDKMWSTGEGNGKPPQYSCLENPMNSMKRQKDKRLKDELPRSVGAQYATGDQFSSIAQLCPTLRPHGLQASLPFTVSWRLLRLVSVKSVMPSNHLILCHPLLLLPSIFPSNKVFSSELALCIRQPKY